MATWNSGFDSSAVTERIERVKIISHTGEVSFPGFTHTEHVSLLASMLRLNSEITENEVRRILNTACFKTAGDGKVTPESLLANVNELEREYLKKAQTRFLLVTSISADFGSLPITLRSKRSVVSFGPKLKPTVAAAHHVKVQDAKHSIYAELPRHYSSVCAFVTARTPDEATTHAIDEIDLVRAIWNFWKNRAHGFRFSSGRRSPVNSLVLGPIHSLHFPSGKLATDAWWFEPTYLGQVNPWKDHDRVPKLLEFTANFRKKLRALPYRSTIEAALLRYVRALDSRDWNLSFLQLWALLEALTGTTLNESHKVTVRRAAFPFKNFAYATQVLNHLRMYRNAAVHEGREGQKIEPVMYQAKNFVEVLLEFHVARAGQFESMSEAAAFLDLPPGLREIDQQLARLRSVRKFVSGNG